MKKLFSLLSICFIIITASFAQTENPDSLHETARNFMNTGDFDNAIIVLNRALLMDKNNLEMEKDLAMSYYLKRDYVNALETVKILMNRTDADVQCFQIAGNVYKALEQPKDCEKAYRRGLKKFPKSGPLLSEYGELLWESKDFSAINQWEKGIEVDPSYSGNYYNAANYYFFTKDKVWSLIYAEIFVNMESFTERSTEMKQMLLDGYKEKLFANADPMKDEGKNRSEFAKAFLQEMSKQSSLAGKGITTEILTMIRTRFILDWYQQGNASRFPFKLFDYHQQLIREGLFDAYNQWLFGPGENLAAYDNWTKSHEEEYNAFNKFQRNHIFRMPPGQYYQAK